MRAERPGELAAQEQAEHGHAGLEQTERKRNPEAEGSVDSGEPDRDRGREVVHPERSRHEQQWQHQPKRTEHALGGDREPIQGTSAALDT